MEIAWYGLSCFRLTERGKATVVTDPYDHTRIGYGALKLRADIVSVSHDAPGHNHVKAVKGVEHIIDGPGEYEIGEVFITGVRTQTGKRSRNGSGSNTLYVFDYDGVTIAHLGDLERTLTQSEVDALGTVSVALVPVGGGSSMSASQAAEVISMLDPGIVIPMHYKTSETSLKLEPLSKFIKEMGLGTVKPVAALKVTPSSVPEETQVVVLDPVS
ncbi:MAG TPA: MBL fold metallo-hydrolase [Anaerolineales bacterium]|nr:MBL fold metallo-hydrolase [Anaerolineales bacterium]